MNKEELSVSLINQKILANWDLSSSKQNFVYEYFGKPFSHFRKALRVYDVSFLIFNGNNAHEEYEFIIRDEQRHWTIKGLKPHHSYCLEYGIKLTEHEFFPLLRSHALLIPGTSIEPSEEIKSEVERALLAKNNSPNWSEQVSTYTYYEKKTTVGEGL